MKSKGPWDCEKTTPRSSFTVRTEDTADEEKIASNRVGGKDKPLRNTGNDIHIGYRQVTHEGQNWYGLHLNWNERTRQECAYQSFCGAGSNRG